MIGAMQRRSRVRCGTLAKRARVCKCACMSFLGPAARAPMLSTGLQVSRAAHATSRSVDATSAALIRRQSLRPACLRYKRPTNAPVKCAVLFIARCVRRCVVNCRRGWPTLPPPPPLQPEPPGDQRTQMRPGVNRGLGFEITAAANRRCHLNTMIATTSTMSDTLRNFDADARRLWCNMSKAGGGERERRMRGGTVYATCLLRSERGLLTSRGGVRGGSRRATDVAVEGKAVR